MDLSTTYLGLKLAHPIVPSCSPLTAHLDGIQRLAEAGAAAVVLPSLFEEEVTREQELLEYYTTYGTESHGEAQTYFPVASDYRSATEEYIRLITRARVAVDIPVIASLNGVSPGGWTQYATLLEEAGAQAVELNLYALAADPDVAGDEVEKTALEVVRAVASTLSIPVAVKLSPFWSSPANMARRLAQAGAAGLVLFNRFYQPDFDLETLTVAPRLVLSNNHELRLPLTWIALLFGRVPVDFALTSGVTGHLDAIKAMMAGASIVQTASELLRNGPERIGQMVERLGHWLEQHEYDSLQQLRGSMSQQHSGEPAAFERANYLRELHSWSESAR